MARQRESARSVGKSDPIDALAVERAVLREPDLPVAYHDEQSMDLKLLVDRREDLVAARTATTNGVFGRLHLEGSTSKPREHPMKPAPKTLVVCQTKGELIGDGGRSIALAGATVMAASNLLMVRHQRRRIRCSQPHHSRASARSPRVKLRVFRSDGRR